MVELGGVKKVNVLAYADDVLLLSREEDEMRELIRTLERFISAKNLGVNKRETKIMRCKYGGGRSRKVKWRCMGEEIEEVRKYVYLGYVVKANGDQEEHLKVRVKKGVSILGQLWGIGKRKFRSDWGRRVWRFDKLVWSVVRY